MRIIDWSSGVCSSDLVLEQRRAGRVVEPARRNRLLRLRQSGADVGAEGEIDAVVVGRNLTKLTHDAHGSEILGETQAGELPALVGVEEIAVGGPHMAARRRAASAAKDRKSVV